MIARLAQSLRARGTDLTEARGALRAFDLQKEHVWRTRSAARDLLVVDGWPLDAVEPIVADWINHGDYLLTYQPPEADFVIGNPPYIRSDDVLPAQRAAYQRRLKTMTAGSDIFVSFIEAGLKSLRKGGVLSFIVADRWMHNTYGRRVRGLVADCFAVEAVVEMHGVNVFAEDVSAYPAVVQMRRARQGEVVTAVANERFNAGVAQHLLAWARSGSAEPPGGTTVRASRLPGQFHTASIWPSASPTRLALLEELNERRRRGRARSSLASDQDRAPANGRGQVARHLAHQSLGERWFARSSR